MTQQQRLHHEQADKQDIQQLTKELMVGAMVKKMRRMGYQVTVEEMEEML